MDTTSRQTSRRRVLAATAAIATATVPSTASASHERNQGILADGVADSGDWSAFIRGWTSRFSSGYGSPPSAETLADRMRNEFNAHSESWIDYGNWLITEYDVEVIDGAVVAVDVAITRARWLTRNESVATTIEVDYDEGADEFVGLEWRLDEADDPDYEVEIRNLAAESAADELQEFRRRHIDPDGGHELPTEEYLSELAGRYGTSIGYGHDARNVTQLLIGGDF